MSLFRRNSKLVERKDEVPGYNAKNKTDRKILMYILISLAILAVLIGGCVALYYVFKV